IRRDVVAEFVTRFVPPQSIDEQWDLPGLQATLEQELGVRVDLQGLVAGAKEIDAEGILEHVQDAVARHFAEREQQIGSETMRLLEKHI
ncbi:hypothetical protein ABTL21_19475, partial [Acinetobacter baumannii]